MIRLALAFLLWTSAAMAAEVVIQAGEHDGFTRLSLHVGEAHWRFGRAGQGYGLRVDATRDFRIERVFQTVTRQRIAGLHPVRGGLDIMLACDCHARVFPYGDGWVVVDIIDGPPEPGAAAEARLDPPASRRTDRGPLPLLLPPRPVPVMFLPDPEAVRMASGSPPPPAAAAGQSAQIGKAVADGLMRAADLGLLDLTPSGVRAVAAVSGTGEAGETTDRAFAPSPAPRSAASPGVIAGTGMDAVVASPGQPRAAGCLDDRLFDLGTWTGAGDFTAELAVRRARLFDAQGAARPEAVEDLARLYLAYGFGREAVETLDLAPREGLDREIMHLLALIVDGRAVAPGPLANQTGCRGQSLLWHVLALESVADLDEPGRTRIITSLRLLSGPLARQLAPRLALLFAQAGDPLAADEILHRASGEGDPVITTRAGVEVARASGDSAATVERLVAAVHDNPHGGPQVLLDMVELTLADHREAEPGDLALLAAARFEYRDRPEEQDLALAQIRLLSHMGDHRAALDLTASLPPGLQATARSEALGRMVDEAGDGQFLELAFDDLPTTDARSAHALAARLIMLGFPERALELMQGVAPGDALAERRFLRAEAAALMGRVDLVEAELLGLSGPRADMIRAAVAPAPGQAAPVAPPDEPPVPGALARGNILIGEADATRNRTRELLDRIAADLSPGHLP